ncbi:MAG: SAM-dependent chlorinase/fluorinase [Bryobacteraceae bacterium]|nr:SAM-dependent chlorinase/fluorinase [Bryobacteraceae bacterium]
MHGKSSERIITLLTDFGLQDHFAGVLKGVIASIAPAARIVDITHEVTPYAVAQARFLLGQSWPYFPKGTIHVAVVDPGVGSARRPILVQAHGQLFAGPDNGLFGDLLDEPRARVRLIANRKLMLHDLSTTFHGRDVFAPVAAYLAAGVAPSLVGPLIHDAIPASTRALQTSAYCWAGEVIHADRFGNLITNLPATSVAGAVRFTLKIGAHELHALAPSYSALVPHSPGIVAGSTGYLEIAVNQDSAARLLGLGVGSCVELSIG